MKSVLFRLDFDFRGFDFAVNPFMISDIGAEQMENVVVHIPLIELCHRQHFLVNILVNPDGKGDFIFLSHNLPPFVHTGILYHRFAEKSTDDEKFPASAQRIRTQKEVDKEAILRYNIGYGVWLSW
jgi:hypothetical protein